MTPNGTNLKKNETRVFDSQVPLEERKAIVAQVTEKFVSPTKLAERHGISVSAIRGWVKTAGKKLPSRHKNMAKYMALKYGNSDENFQNHVGKNFVCSTCGYAVRTNHHLRQHILKQHPQDPRNPS